MRIRKLQASFGKLKNESLRFHDGLNVIYAPNESGKSTWCAFIRAMLYGIDSSERARAGSLPDKQRLVFNMKYFNEMKYEEISEALGTSVGALKASFHIAVKKIEEYFNNID